MLCSATPDIDEPLGILLTELGHAAGRRDVGHDDEDPRVLAGDLVERPREGVSHSVASHSESSRSACWYSWGFGER